MPNSRQFHFFLVITRRELMDIQICLLYRALQLQIFPDTKI